VTTFMPKGRGNGVGDCRCDNLHDKGESKRGGGTAGLTMGKRNGGCWHKNLHDKGEREWGMQV
jgi:hypothetical protein